MRAGWSIKPFNEVCTLQRGFDLPSAQRKLGSIPLVSSSGVIDRVDQSQVRAPGVVTGRSGSIGAVFFIDQDFWPLNTTLYVKNFHGNDERFVFYLLLSLDLGRFASGAGVPTLNRNHLAERPILVPPLEEQRRIVKVLDEAFAAIPMATANAEKNLANTRELPAGRLARILAELDEVTVVPISEVAFIQEGPGIRKYEYQEDGFPMINVRCVQDGWIDMSSGRAVNAELATGKWRHFQVEEHDILFTTSGTIGRCAIAGADDLPLLMNTSVVRFRSQSSELLQRYLYHFLRSDLFQIPLKKLASGTAISNVGPTHIKSLSIPIPPLGEQRRIINLLDKLIQLSAELHEIVEQKLLALDKLTQSILQRALSGEFADREPLAA